MAGELVAWGAPKLMGVGLVLPLGVPTFVDEVPEVLGAGEGFVLGADGEFGAEEEVVEGAFVEDAVDDDLVVGDFEVDAVVIGAEAVEGFAVAGDFAESFEV